MSQSWQALNRERGKLIDKSIAGTITEDEQKRLIDLQSCAEAHIQKAAPRDSAWLDELEQMIDADDLAF